MGREEDRERKREKYIDHFVQTAMNTLKIYPYAFRGCASLDVIASRLVGGSHSPAIFDYVDGQSDATKGKLAAYPVSYNEAMSRPAERLCLSMVLGSKWIDRHNWSSGMTILTEVAVGALTIGIARRIWHCLQDKPA